MRVVDASVGFKWFAMENDTDLAMMLLNSGEPLIAPDIIVPECAHAARRRAGDPDFPESAAEQMFHRLPRLLEEIVPTAHLMDAAVRLGREFKHKDTYDCFYLALAIERRAPVVTADMDLIRKARRAGYGEFIVHLSDAVRKE